MDQKSLFNFYRSCTLDLKQLIAARKPLTFLAGAGISISPPSGLMSSSQIIESIIRFGADADSFDRIMKIKQLRFEFLVQLFRDQYDPALRLIEYFEQSTRPNVLHEYLAKMIREGQYVLTTNFDTLIERAVGLSNSALKIVLTREDFEISGNPGINVEKGLFAVYKIHGSLRNMKSGEDTKESIIATLDALGKHKNGDFFLVETFKRMFFEKVCNKRVLVAMGYSGGDDLDIIPSLLQMVDIERIYWIDHNTESDTKFQAYVLHPPEVIHSDEIADLSPMDRFLYNMTLKNVEVIKVVANTPNLVSYLMGANYRETRSYEIHDMYEWLVESFPQPSFGDKYSFSAQVLFNYGFYREALTYFLKAHQMDEGTGNHRKLAGESGNIGLLYRELGEPKKALDYHQSAYKIHKEYENNQGMAKQLGNIGLCYENLGSLQDALNYHTRAYHLQKRSSNLLDMASTLNNIGLIHKTNGSSYDALEKFKDAYQIYDQVGDLLGLARVQGNMGIIYKTIGKSQKAMNLYEQALKIYRRLCFLPGISAILNNMTAIYLEMKNTSKALICLQEAYEIQKHDGNYQQMASILNNQGLVYRDLGNIEKAMEYYQKAFDLNEKIEQVKNQ